jgi:hypothetical protein
MPFIGSPRIEPNRPVHFDECSYWLWCPTQDRIFCCARDANSKDGPHWLRDKGRVGPAEGYRGQKENSLAVVDDAQLYDPVVTR